MAWKKQCRRAKINFAVGRGINPHSPIRFIALDLLIKMPKVKTTRPKKTQKSGTNSGISKKEGQR